jgi:hypothetical protein
MEYLRRTHLFCYYCGSDSDSVEEFTRKCPGRHLRKSVVTSESKASSKNSKEKSNSCMLHDQILLLHTFVHRLTSQF